ncbi:MAG TPA: MaoC/PaaZ C-terminal domain-containing protein [Candidatus Dormibacteraeota bacterium]|jgi:acyl dehydratase|nr:MaoC/PaaZ C-terminal domain-containing protein [Candidatus Dormibacteraeota bacterium]
MAATTTLRFGDVKVGDALPEEVIELTPTLIIASAIATRDFQDVHHDMGLAVERGMPNIFMNILSTNGFIGRFVTDWAGPEARVKSIAIRLGAPNFPGDVMRMSGRVAAAEAVDGEGVVEVEVRGVNSMGDHATGKVVVALPT